MCISIELLCTGQAKKESAESIAVVIFIVGFSVRWTNVYDKKVYYLIFREKKSEEPEKRKGVAAGIELRNEELTETWSFGFIS